MKTALRNNYLILCTGLVLLLTGAQSLAQAPFDRPLIFGVNPVSQSADISRCLAADELMWQRLQEIGAQVMTIAAATPATDCQALLEQALQHKITPVLTLACDISAASPVGLAHCRQVAGAHGAQCNHFVLLPTGWQAVGARNAGAEFAVRYAAARDILRAQHRDTRVALGLIDSTTEDVLAFLQAVLTASPELAPDALALPLLGRPVAGMLDLVDRVADIPDLTAPLWILDWGWPVRGIGADEAGRMVEQFLEALVTRPRVQLAVYRQIMDTPEDLQGYGLCDANGRKRLGFYSFCDRPAHARPFVYRTQCALVAPGAISIEWRTRLPMQTDIGYVPLDWPVEDQASAPGPKTRRSEVLPQEHHFAVINNLAPGRLYEFAIDSVTKQATLDRTTFRIAGYELFNGDFEAGFEAGLAQGWQITGAGLAADAACVPGATTHAGAHAQVIWAPAGSSLPVEALITTAVHANPQDRLLLSAWGWGTGPGIQWQLGCEPRGDSQPDSRTAIWTEWMDAGSDWRQAQIPLTSQSQLVYIFIRCRGAGLQTSEPRLFVLDQVQLQPRP